MKSKLYILGIVIYLIGICYLTISLGLYEAISICLIVIGYFLLTHVDEL